MNNSRVGAELIWAGLVKTSSSVRRGEGGGVGKGGPLWSPAVPPPAFSMRPLPLCSHNVIARINKENFAGDGAGMGAAQEERGIAYVALLDVSAQWGCYSHLFAETGKA